MEIRIDRLRKLADFLAAEIFPNENDAFDFGKTYRKDDCGTLACAWGWTPIVFPDEIKLDKDSLLPRLIKNPSKYTWEDCRDFFQLNIYDSYHIFEPGHQLEKYGEILNSDATAKEVADNIYEFCNLVEKGKI